MADNLANGSGELEGKGGSLENGKKLTIKKSPKKKAGTGEGDTPRLGKSKINESGKGSAGR